MDRLASFSELALNDTVLRQLDIAQLAQVGWIRVRSPSMGTIPPLLRPRTIR